MVVDTATAEEEEEMAEILTITSVDSSPSRITTPRPRAAGIVLNSSSDGGNELEGEGGAEFADGVGENSERLNSSFSCGEVATSTPSPLDDEDEDDDLCAICFTGPRDAVLLECGHGGICYSCARRCLRKKGRECPMCRAPVDQVVQIRLDGAPASPSHTGVVRVKQTDLPDDVSLD